MTSTSLIVDDPANTYDPAEAAEETDLFGDNGFTGNQAPEPEPEKTSRRGRPGPPPNPNSQRQRKLAKAATRSRTAPAPPKKRTANTPHSAIPSDTYQRGAVAVIGWVARPLAVAGFAMTVVASMPNRETDPRRKAEAERKRQALAFQGQALTLDTLAINMHADALAEGLASAAEHLPWMARVLEQAARISPFATLLEAGMAIGLQILTNHGVMPPMTALNTLGPEELAEAAGVPMEEQ